MSIAVLIPWRTTTCHDRRRALEYVIGRYRHAHPDWQIAVGRSDAGPWIKAAAVAAALRQTTAQTLILADADVWCDDLADAVEHVQGAQAWGIPHRGVFRLSAAATRRYLVDDGAAWRDLELAERPYLGVEGGGIVVMRRTVYDACPLDPRFEGWGSEDDAWGYALRTLFGAPWRGKSALVHLWHPPQDRATRSYGSLASRDLRKRYVRANGDQRATRALIAETV